MRDLPFDTPTQIAALILTLVAGWLFGLASAPRGGRWRDRYQSKEVEHATYRDGTDRRLREQDQRIRELEADIKRLGGGTAVAAAAASAAADSGGWRGWFGWGRDNLSRIRGVDAVREARLNELGVKTYREIETMSVEEESTLEERLGIAKGTIASEDWRAQAALLRAGGDEEHGTRFG